GGTMWMGSMARKHPELKFLSMSPGGTRGTNGMDDLPFLKRIFLKYIGMRIIMPLLGMSHSVEAGAKRFVDAISNDNLVSGRFYASKEKVLTGNVIDQSTIWADLKNVVFQDNAHIAIQSFLE
ncbi:MAG: short-chain dehydrogenase, partial [Bacteroidota bacterium]